MRIVGTYLGPDGPDPTSIDFTGICTSPYVANLLYWTHCQQAGPDEQQVAIADKMCSWPYITLVLLTFYCLPALYNSPPICGPNFVVYFQSHKWLGSSYLRGSRFFLHSLMLLNVKRDSEDARDHVWTCRIMGVSKVLSEKGPWLWNSLPLEIWLRPQLATFRVWSRTLSASLLLRTKLWNLYVFEDVIPLTINL